MVQSAENGRYYATAKKCSITSTFTEEQAKALIGKELPGHIAKIACPEFEYTIEETGEVITLSHRWGVLARWGVNTLACGVLQHGRLVKQASSVIKGSSV